MIKQKYGVVYTPKSLSGFVAELLKRASSDEQVKVILDPASLTYTWYAQDKDGNEITFGKTGKVIYLSAADIDSIITLQCDVSN